MDFIMVCLYLPISAGKRQKVRFKAMSGLELIAEYLLHADEILAWFRGFLNHYSFIRQRLAFFFLCFSSTHTHRALFAFLRDGCFAFGMGLYG